MLRKKITIFLPKKLIISLLNIKEQLFRLSQLLKEKDKSGSKKVHLCIIKREKYITIYKECVSK
jgi:hypothetical protein